MPPRILQYSDLEGAFDAPERVARVAGLLRERRTEETIVVGSGDTLAPSVLSLATDGRHVIDFYRAVEPDVETVGNHDFDRGLDAFRDVIARSPQQWLTTNCFVDGDRLGVAAGARPSTVVSAGDADVGLVGVTSPDTPAMNPLAADLTVTDPVPAVEAAVETLRRDRDVDYVVVLAHLGTEPSFVRDLDVAVDAVCGGHVHDALATVVDGTPVCRPGPDGHQLCEITLGERPSVRHVDVADGPVDESLRDALRRRIDEAGLADVVGTVADPMHLDREASLFGESRAGNLVTDAMRWACDADVAALAHGALRARDPLEGAVTAFELRGVVPFDDDLAVVELSERQLRAVLDALVRRSGAAVDRDWNVGHLSGGTVEFDADGSLVEATVDGRQVTADESYALATTSYYVETDHLFDAFGPPDVQETPGSLHEALVRYADEHGLNPTVDGRISRPGGE